MLIVFVGLFLSCKDSTKNESQAANSSETSIKEIKAPSETVVNDITGIEEQKIPRTTIEKVTVEEAKKLAQQGYKFLDIRTPAEIKRGKIKDAMELDVKSYKFQSDVNLMARDAKLIVYCSAGNRSALASKLFSTLGFTNVVEMPGGYMEWITKEKNK